MTAQTAPSQHPDFVQVSCSVGSLIVNSPNTRPGFYERERIDPHDSGDVVYQEWCDDSERVLVSNATPKDGQCSHWSPAFPALVEAPFEGFVSVDPYVMIVISSDTEHVHIIDTTSAQTSYGFVGRSGQVYVCLVQVTDPEHEGVYSWWVPSTEEAGIEAGKKVSA